MDVWQPNSPLSGLPFVKRNVRSRRASSWDRSGANRDFAVVAPGETHVLADIEGAGCIRHIWMTTRCYAPQYLRKLVLEMHWDGEENPSVRVPYGDFFGIGHATCRHFVSLPLNMVFGKRRGPKGPFSASNNCFFPMPFSDGARIQLINESEEPIANLFYYVDYESMVEETPEDMGRFHACWNLENPTAALPHDQISENPAPWDLAGTNLTGEEHYLPDADRVRGRRTLRLPADGGFRMVLQVFPYAR